MQQAEELREKIEESENPEVWIKVYPKTGRNNIVWGRAVPDVSFRGISWRVSPERFFLGQVTALIRIFAHLEYFGK